MLRFYNILCFFFSIFTMQLICKQTKRASTFMQALCAKYKCGTIPYPSNTGKTTPNPITNSPQVWQFVSELNLHPMKVTINRNETEEASSGFVFVAPYAFSGDAIYGQPGSLIMDNEGNPIWFRPLASPNLMNTDFRVQSLNGKSVLTFWQGTLATPPGYTNTPAGSSEPGSCYFILDNNYNTIAKISAQRGFTSDIHEFLLTPQNSALLLSTKKVAMDLTPYGGPKNGYVQDFAIQEIDIKTNKLLFFWSALDHIPLTESYEPASSATSSSNIWDAYHFNSIGLTNNQDEIIFSSRNMWTIYKINKHTGEIIWRLGGKKSDFKIEKDAHFSWQHDARFLPGNTISMFDDNCCESATIPPRTPYAHGLILQLNFTSMTATLKHSYYHDPLLQISSQGNVQSLDNGNKFIGWGQSQYYSEFKQAGNNVSNPSLNMVYDAQMPGNNYTYRAYRHNWVGLPDYSPSIAVIAALNTPAKLRTKPSPRSELTHIVFASWNGSTEYNAWQIFAGKSPDNLHLIKTVAKSGFETFAAVNNSGPYFMVKALNGKGQVIGKSKITKLS